MLSCATNTSTYQRYGKQQRARLWLQHVVSHLLPRSKAGLGGVYASTRSHHASTYGPRLAILAIAPNPSQPYCSWTIHKLMVSSSISLTAALDTIQASCTIVGFEQQPEVVSHEAETLSRQPGPADLVHVTALCCVHKEDGYIRSSCHRQSKMICLLDTVLCMYARALPHAEHWQVLKYLLVQHREEKNYLKLMATRINAAKSTVPKAAHCRCSKANKNTGHTSCCEHAYMLFSQLCHIIVKLLPCRVQVVQP